MPIAFATRGQKGTDDDGVTTTTSNGGPSAGVYAQVAALLHESRQQPPDQLGTFLARRVSTFGMTELSVYVTDLEQRHLVPIAGSAQTSPIDMEDCVGGKSFTLASQLVEPTEAGPRLWSVVIDGAAQLGVMAVTVADVDDQVCSVADSLAGVVAALLVTRGQCTDAYLGLRRTRRLSLAAEMQWDLLPPLSLDSGSVSVAGLIQPAYEVGGDAFDYAVNGNVLDFAVFDAMGHGLEASQLAHLAVSSYRSSRRSGLDLEDTYLEMDAVVADMANEGEQFVTCIMGRLDLATGDLRWLNLGHPLPLLVRDDKVVGPLMCEPRLPAGLGRELAHNPPSPAHHVLQPNDRLFCITDGIIDSHRRGGADFGEGRLVELLDQHSRRPLNAAETVRQLSHTVLDHHGVLSDDTTAFLIEFHPEPDISAPRTAN